MGTVEVNGYTIEPRASLSGANLSGANFSGANFSGADLSGAVANVATVWPDDFDPVAAGVTFV